MTNIFLCGLCVLCGFIRPSFALTTFSVFSVRSVVLFAFYVPQKPFLSEGIDFFAFGFEVVVGFFHEDEAEVQPEVEEFLGEFGCLAGGDDIVFCAVDDEVFAVARELTGEIDCRAVVQNFDPIFLH